MRSALAMTVLVIPAMWLAPAAAAPATSLHVSPTSAPAGGLVQVSGTCQASTSGFALSPAFLHDATHDFAGVAAVAFQSDAAGAFSVTAAIPATIAPGSYAVTARCGGGNLGISATLIVTGPSGGPTGVPAGSGAIAARHSSDGHQLSVALAIIGAALGAAGGLGMARRRTSH